ncbi:MAG: chemotaxis protein CheR, partial [Chloroflexi bacterium]|nr:chemotaxis protein CheR [Chloroflexota bacterium]
MAGKKAGTRDGGKSVEIVAGIGIAGADPQLVCRLIACLPSHRVLACVIVVHGDFVIDRWLTQLRQISTPLGVAVAAEGIAIEAGNVYLVPSQTLFGLRNGTFYRQEPAETQDLEWPVDFFLRSLAEDHKMNAAGILLSGTGADGVLGLEMVKGVGGLVLLSDQLPGGTDEQLYKTHLEPVADVSGPVQELAASLIEYIAQANRKPAAQNVKSDTESTYIYQRIYAWLQNQTEHDFSGYKRQTMVRRIERRMHLHHLKTISEYLQYLHQDLGETDLLHKDLLIGVTGFFRDPEAFAVLAETVIPQLVGMRRPQEGKSLPIVGGSGIRVWVPACATGEEAYSIAILLAEALEGEIHPPPLRIFATDANKEAIATAQAGIYPVDIASDVSPERLKRFFARQGSFYRINKDIRDKVVFAPQNVLQDPPFAHVNFVSCRNLMIYLQPQSQNKLISLFHYALNPGGFLFLGSSESLPAENRAFRVANKKWKIFQRLAVPYQWQAELFSLPLQVSGENRAFKGVRQNTMAENRNTVKVIEGLLLERYVPACVVVDEEYNIIHYSGKTGKFLEQPPGEPTSNLLKLARPGLEPELSGALFEATQEKRSVRRAGLKVTSNGDIRPVDLLVEPLSLIQPDLPFLLVIFEEAPPPVV